jgi:outer membrane protein assembly factor BamB
MIIFSTIMNLRKMMSIIFISLFLTPLIFSDEDPEILWRYTTGGRIITAPVEGKDNTVYFCSEDRFLYALKNDGELKWRLNLEDRLTDTLVIGYDNTIYTGSKRGFFIAVNPAGEQIWKVKVEGEPFGNPAVLKDGTIFLTTKKGWLYSISHTGFIHWKVKLPAEPVLSPVIGKDIYIGLANERIYAYSINGIQKWMFLLSGLPLSFALSGNSIYAGTKNSTLVSIDHEGSRKWNISLSGSVNAIAILSENRIVCSTGNNITMIDSDSSQIWNSTLRNIQIDIAASSSGIVSLSSDGRLVLLDFDGDETGRLQGGISTGSLLLSNSGDIYLGSKDWLFYKYGFKNLVANKYSEHIWPSFRGGNENRGSSENLVQVDRKFFASADYIYLIELSKSMNEKILEDLLDEIEKRIYSEEYDSGKDYLLDILEILASEGVKNPLYEEGRLINDFPVIRSRAIENIGIVGNFYSRDFLSDLLNYEWDNYAVNSIIKSIGNLLSDMDNISTHTLVNYYRPNSPDLDLRILRQILMTVQKMNNYSGYSNIDLILVITDIFLKSSTKSIKEFSLDIINSIKK